MFSCPLRYGEAGPNGICRSVCRGVRLPRRFQILSSYSIILSKLSLIFSQLVRRRRSCAVSSPSVFIMTNTASVRVNSPVFTSAPLAMDISLTAGYWLETSLAICIYGISSCLSSLIVFFRFEISVSLLLISESRPFVYAFYYFRFACALCRNPFIDADLVSLDAVFLCGFKKVAPVG